MKDKKVTLLLCIFAVMLITGFILPFLINNRDEIKENLKPTSNSATFDGVALDELKTIKNTNHNIIATMLKMQSENIVELRVKQITNQIEYQWNETPTDILSEENHITTYEMCFVDTKGTEIIETRFVTELKIPLPNDYNKESIKVFLQTNDEIDKMEYTIDGNHLIVATDKLGTLTIINDENKEDVNYFAEICSIGLRYENKLSLKISADIYANKVENQKILMWTKEQEIYNIENAEYANDIQEDGYFLIKNIDFKDIDKSIYIRLYSKINDEYIYSKVIEYNILQYCINMFNNTDSIQLKELILGTICYAQMSGDYIEENKNIFNQFAIATQTEKTMANLLETATFNGENIYKLEGKNSFYGRNISFNNKITYNAYLKPAYEKDVENIYLQIIINGKEYREKFARDFAYGFYKASFDELQPYDINTPIQLTVMYNDGTPYGGTITDSVGTFIQQGMQEYTLQKDKDMFAATIYFMNACEQYFIMATK